MREDARRDPADDGVRDGGATLGPVLRTPFGRALRPCSQDITRPPPGFTTVKNSLFHSG